MNIYYIVNARMPTERAHGVHIAHMCSAFAKLGNTVTLVLPRRVGRYGDIFDYYGIPHNFEVKYLPVIDLIPILDVFGTFTLELFTFGIMAKLWLLFQKSGVVYTRDETVFFVTPFWCKRFTMVWETHIKPRRLIPLFKSVTARCSLLVAVTKRYAQELPGLFSIKPDRVVYEPDAVALEPFENLLSREEARVKLGLPKDKKIAMYAGTFQSWKGVGLLERAAEFLPKDFLTVFVGDHELLSTDKKLYVGHQPYTLVPEYLAAADVLVLTADIGSETARYYTSPLKMFEYMASGRPIVAFDVPSFRDILSDDTARFVSGNSEQELAEVISDIVKDDFDRASKAKILVQKYSWFERARRLSESIKKVI